MKKYKEIVDGLLFEAKSNPNAELVTLVEFLNRDFAKIQNSSKAKFLTWLENQLMNLETNYLNADSTKKQISHYELQYFYALQYFITKETIGFDLLSRQINKIKEYTQRKVYAKELLKIKEISQQLSILPSEQKRCFLLEQHNETLKEFELKSNIRQGFYNPLFEELSIYGLLGYQKKIKNELNLFWLPMPNNENLADFKNSTIGEIIFYSIGPSLELYYTLLWINNQLEPEQTTQDNQETIIEKDYLSIIYKRFKELFSGETLDSWLERFVYPTNNKIGKIEVTEKAKEGSNKLVLLAILDAVQQVKYGNFVYQNFVSDRFGIINFYRYKNEHKDKRTYQETLKICSQILENDIF